MFNAEYEVVLCCPMDASNGAQAARVGEYLGLLLSTLWLQGDGFSGKRPFGNSGWEYDVYAALARAGIIDGLVVDEDGYVVSFDRDAQIRADELILQTIIYMTRTDGTVRPLYHPNAPDPYRPASAHGGHNQDVQ